jgi:glycosyltransferase involved in cell wall biosynthesis
VRIVFIHRTFVEYTVETPYQRAIGGTEAGLCYLCAELAKLGHSVVLASNPPRPGRHLDVDCIDYKTGLTPELFDRTDVVVVANEACGAKLRDFGVTKPLVLWTGHAEDQPSIRPLEFARERKAWSGFAFVSRWQLDHYARTFWVPRARSRVMRNAIAPSFSLTPSGEAWFKKGTPPVLVYASAPHRGLDVLLAAFPAVRDAFPGTTLRVFSGSSLNRGEPDDGPFLPLHRLCVATPAVDYVGPVSQPALAEAFSDAAALAYPCTFPETSCIVAMEAMAMGALVLTTDFGALSETLAGFGRMIALEEDFGRLARDYAALVIEALVEMQRSPEAACRRRTAQIAFARETYDWAARAIEWQSWLGELTAQLR